MIRIRQLLTVAIVPLLIACGAVADANHSPVVHNCRIVSTNTEWSVLQLSLHHDDTRSCPRNVTPGDIVNAGGLIDEPNAKQPYLSNRHALKALLFINNSNGSCDPENLGSVVAGSEQWFSYADWDYDGIDDWQAGLWVSYTSATGYDQNRDCPVFEVRRFAGAMPSAVAFTEVRYTLNDQ